MKKSFTLIELLVAIAIIGLLVIIAIPINRARRGASIARILQYEASLHRYLGADIVGWWKLDGDLNDISGYNNHGSWEGGGDPQYLDGVPGKEGYALEFDGTDDYVDVGQIKEIDFGTGTFTISQWFKIVDLSKSVSLFSKGGGHITNSADRTPGIVYGRHSNGSFRTQITDGENIRRITSSWGDSLEWENVVVTIDRNANVMSIYRNTNLLGQANISIIENIDHPNSVRLGAARSTIQFFAGIISDVRIYSRALTSKEINALYVETKDKYISKNEK